MKDFFKDIIPAIVLSFVFSFMVFIYEPIIMYLNNLTDFWFDIYVLLNNSLIGSAVLFLVISVVFIVIYTISKYLLKSKNNRVFNFFLTLGYGVFFITYIQGNYLSGSLPTLDGNIINWNDYTTQSIISIFLLIIIATILILVTIKFKYSKTIKYSNYVTLAVFAMLSISLIGSCITVQNGFKRKTYTTTPTTKYINEYSTNNNLIVFLLDSIDSSSMESIIKKNPDYLKVFDDFTYYPDTVGGYPFTRDTIPLVLSGNWSENKMNFFDFYNEAMDNSKLLDYLREKEYNINIYNNEISYNTEKARDIKNLSFDNKSDCLSFIKQELKYVLFKYLPYYLKHYSRIENMDFNKTRIMNDDELFIWDDVNFLNVYLEKSIEKRNSKQFKFIHLEGAHYPYDCDSNFEKKENGTINDKIEASIKLINRYLTYLKDNNVYNNSAIIILADHGFWNLTDDNNLLKRQNPILYIKGFNEHHERIVSKEKVSFDNLQDIYRELLNGAKTETLFNNIDTSNPRRFLLYRVGGYDHMEEFLQYGKAGDLSTLKKTGNTYDLEKR